jgi:hypothetical protein
MIMPAITAVVAAKVGEHFVGRQRREGPRSCAIQAEVSRGRPGARWVRSIVLPGDQFPMPSQQSLWRDNGGDLGQNPSVLRLWL